MKKEVNAEGKPVLKFTRAEWEDMGRKAGWIPEKEPEKADTEGLGWTLEKQAQVDEDRTTGGQFICRVCGQYGPPEDFDQGCPNCGSKFIDR
jgi:rubrerythrin